MRKGMTVALNRLFKIIASLSHVLSSKNVLVTLSGKLKYKFL